MVLRKRAGELLDHVTGEENIDATGQEQEHTDYNFDILRQHYAGTDFENEANSLCDVLSTFSLKNKGSNTLIPVVTSIRGILKGPDGNIFPGFEPYEDFISKLMDMAESIAKSNVSPGMDPIHTPIDEQALPNVKDSQAKLLELEQYIASMNLEQRQKWKDYLAEARKRAAVGDDSFNAMPELDYEDMAYLKESERQKTNRDAAKQAMLQQMVGVQNAGQP